MGDKKKNKNVKGIVTEYFMDDWGMYYLEKGKRVYVDNKKKED